MQLLHQYLDPVQILTIPLTTSSLYIALYNSTPCSSTVESQLQYALYIPLELYLEQLPKSQI